MASLVTVTFDKDELQLFIEALISVRRWIDNPVIQVLQTRLETALMQETNDAD